MNIVVLDGWTLNPGDLDWKRLEQLGCVTVYERTTAAEIVSRAAQAEIVLTNKTSITAAVLEQLPKLRYIGLLATGYNVVDTAVARQRGIPVTNIPTYGTHSVAQFVFALLLELCHRVQKHSDAVHAGKWTRSPDFCFTLSPLVELSGKTLGLIGLGRIGGQVAKVARAFDMRVIAVGSGRSKPVPVEGVEWVDLNRLLTESDVVSLHCPLTAQTDKLINKERLTLMKSSAFLINTSRGALINEQALADALNGGRLAGAAVDVLSVEPSLPDNPLFSAANCLITPHIAWATKEARTRLMETAVDNVQSFIAGRPVHVVNG